jgi:hypothetical protein
MFSFVSVHVAPTERLVLLDASYKHLAALRPGPSRSNIVQQHTITTSTVPAIMLSMLRSIVTPNELSMEGVDTRTTRPMTVSKQFHLSFPSQTLKNLA